MALPQTKPILIPAPLPSSPSSSPRSHFRCGSDAGSDLSISLPLSAVSTFRKSAAQDPFAAIQLQHTLSGFSAQDILSSNTHTRSRLVVLSESISIEAAGQRLAESNDADTWILLKRDKSKSDAPDGVGKLRTSDCAGLLSLDDLAAFFAAVFGPHHTQTSIARPRGAAHDLASPPASPSTSSSRFHLSQSVDSQNVTARVETIRAQLMTRKAVTASLVSNLSANNSLRHVSLDASLLDIMHELSCDEVNCLLVSVLHQSQDGAVCGILTASDVVAFLVAEAERNASLASIFSDTLDLLASSELLPPAAIISGDKSPVDALVRMQSEHLSVLAVTDPFGGLISPISSREISQEILKSSSRKILTMPISSLVKDLRSRHPQGADGKDVRPAISVSSSSTVGRAAALLLATEAGGVFVMEEPRVIMTPPLSCISASPGKELSSLSLDADLKPLSRSVSFTPAPAQKHRRSSTHFWTSSRASISSSASNEAATRPAMPNFALGSSASDAASDRRSSLTLRPDQALSLSVSSLPAKSLRATTPALLRTPSGPSTHRPRSLSLAHFSVDEWVTSRQFGAQAALRSQGSWTPGALSSGSSVCSADSPSSPFGNMLVSGFFSEVMQNGMPRCVVTIKTVLRCVLAATTTTVDVNEEAVEA